ncbi:MinD/ParA family protein [Halobacillus kuroshimensis]|uniref:MinD/ParA family protein n=1 Tax=Halobacillus kuroshimensis TaxID=302481 RepID=A0ABS3DSZ9_9BACI|nr:MinD/ParA family protein [Halobacillus kuroshimensis]MBN8234469.1 MinD/ParA family protein [Halobacillus kuroshimensis]
MKDQAELLRTRMISRESKPPARVVAVASGKGGVGKSNITINMALSLCRSGRKVLVLDMDVGMGNVDILLGRTSAFSLPDLIRNRLTFQEIIEHGPGGLDYAAGGSGLTELFNMNAEDYEFLNQQLEDVSKIYDVILLDMGAGITESSRSWLLSAHEVIIVTTPEPTSITDAYALMKQLVYLNPVLPFSFIVNRAQTRPSGERTLARLQEAAHRFLHVDVHQLGVVLEDRQVLEAVLNQVPFLIHAPWAKASRAVDQITGRFLNRTSYKIHLEEPGFLEKLKRLVRKGEA